MPSPENNFTTNIDKQSRYLEALSRISNKNNAPEQSYAEPNTNNPIHTTIKIIDDGNSAYSPENVLDA